MPQPERSPLELLFVILSIVGPVILRTALSRSKAGVKIFDFFSRMLKRASAAAESDADDDEETERIRNVERDELERWHENSMALHGSNVRQLDMLATSQSRLDTTIMRVEENNATGFRAVREHVLEVSREIRSRMDSTLIADGILHKQQNETLKRHEDDISKIEKRLTQAEDTIITTNRLIHEMRGDLNAMKGLQ